VFVAGGVEMGSMVQRQDQMSDCQLHGVGVVDQKKTLP
jgi:hypothetical protein